MTISDFGWTGPWSERPATEFTLQADSGLTGFRGDPEGPPISIGGDLGEYMGATWAAYGAMALRRRVARGGPGGHLDLSMLEAITLMQSSEWLHSQLLKRPPVKRSVEVPSIEPAKDGYVGISMVTGQQWLDFAAMVDCPDFTEIPQLRFQIGRWDYRDWIRERIDPWMRERTVAEIVELGQLFRLPLAPLGNGSTIPDMDHLQTRGVYIDNPAGFRQPRAPWLMSIAAPGTGSPGARRSGKPTTYPYGSQGNLRPAHGPRKRRWPVCGSSISRHSGPVRRAAHRWRPSAPTSSRSSRSSGPTESAIPAECAPTSTTGGSTAGCSMR